MSRKLWLAAGWLQVVAVALLCLWPLPKLPGPELPWVDKLYHAAAFGQLMWWFAVGSPRDRWPAIALRVLGFGIGIELAQGVVPYRSASIADAVADAVGVFIAALVARITPRRLFSWEPRV